MQANTAQVIRMPGQAAVLTEELMSEWIASTDCNHCTRRAYSTAIRQMLDYFNLIGKTQPERSDLHAWRAELLKDHAAGTVSLYITAARLFFKWLDMENRFEDISRGIKGAKSERGFKKDSLTPHAARETLAAVNGLRDTAILTLMITTGLRCIEVSRANIEDIRTVGDSAVLYVQGKGRLEKNEYVKLSPHAHKALLAYLADKKENTGALFTSTSNNSTGKRLTTTSISAIVKAAMRAAGYDSKRLTAHSLRHTAATLNLMAGGTLQETQQLLRHQNINTTMIYSQNLERMANQSETRIDAMIFNAD